MVHDTMKKKIVKEYLRRVRKVAQSKLNGGNLIRAINTWAVSLVRYSGGTVDWKKQEVQDVDHRTRKLLTMHGGFHPRDLKIPKVGKRCHFMGKLRDRAKIKEAMKHGLG